ncbi:type II toxin-antitoxin system PrlF family antitoxin [Massilia sp. W12]|uniref:type II toxin-antitoxin system PrlF family antitoxin n=1 Tax=Massilia sp. W12 TaxID=3126507 RepID=UPI0030D1F468
MEALADFVDWESSLTDRYQTTVPEAVRQVLGLKKRDKLRFSLRADGSVLLSRAEPQAEQDDPALNAFLALLENDISQQPQRLQALGAVQVAQWQALVQGVDVDLDAALPEDE